MFNLTDTNISVPKLTDVINSSEFPPNVLQIFTYVWVWFLGAWFYAAVVGAVGAALYIKYDNAMVPIVFFMVMFLLLGGTSGVLFVSTNTMPSAAIFVYLIGILASFVVGLTIYMLLISKRE